MKRTDFDNLTRETLRLSEGSAPGPSCEGAGIVFYLSKGPNTFCLRGIPTIDCQKTLALVGEGDESTLKALRAKDLGQEALSTFPTGSVAFAETLVDEVANRRFPLREEALCNLSDPGFYWWMDEGEDQWSLFFQSCEGDRQGRPLCLGPLGDPFIAYQRFRQSSPFLKHCFGIDTFSVTEKLFSLPLIFGDGRSMLFKEIFVNGEVTWDSEDLPASFREDTLDLYFQELALKRRFWCSLEKQLHPSLSPSLIEDRGRE